MKISGFDNLKNMIEKLERGIENVQGEHSVPIKELLTPSFLRQHTTIESVDELLEGSPIPINSTEDFRAVPTVVWDEYIRGISSFKSWREMVTEAAKEYFLRKFDF